MKDSFSISDFSIEIYSSSRINVFLPGLSQGMIDSINPKIVFLVDWFHKAPRSNSV